MDSNSFLVALSTVDNDIVTFDGVDCGENVDCDANDVSIVRVCFICLISVFKEHILSVSFSNQK